MRKQIRIIALIMAVFSIFCSLSSCSSKDSEYALSFGKYTIDESMYSYWSYTLKKYYVEQYSDVKDTTEFWNSYIEDTNETYGEYMDYKIKTQIEHYLVAQKLFDDYKLSLSDAVIDSINDSIDQQTQYHGSKSAFNKALSQFGMNISKLKDLYRIEQKYNAVLSYLYDEKSGAELATDEEVDEYFKSNYMRIKYWMVLKNKKYKLDEKGNRVTDSKTGYYVYENLTADEIAANAAHAQEVYNAVKDGTKTIDEYIKADFPELNYPNGYYVTADDFNIHSVTVIKSALEMKVGETVLAENDDSYFVICKYELIDNAYKGDDKDQFIYLLDYVNGANFENKFAALVSLVECNNAVVDKYSVYK